MKHFELKGQAREAGNKAVIKAFRKQGLVPCNLYGNGMENVLFTVEEKELKGLTHTPYSHIVDIVLDNGKTYTAIVHELQYHPVEDNCLHVDFLFVNEEKPIAINVPINIQGHAVGVRAGGRFVLNQRNIRVSAQMKNLPDEVVIDITPLKIGGQVVAGDIKLDNVTVLEPKEKILCAVKATRNASSDSTSAAEGEPAAEEGQAAE